jgi:hypothetical protein
MHANEDDEDEDEDEDEEEKDTQPTEHDELDKMEE